MSKTLLFVVNVDWFFLSHRLPIAEKALSEDFKVHIATGITDRREILCQNGLVVHCLALNRNGTGIGNALRTAAQLWKIFRNVRPDVVHLVTIKPVLLGGIVARVANVPAVVAAVSGLGFVFMARGLGASIRRGAVSLMYRLALSHKNIKVIFQNPDDLQSVSSMAHLDGEKAALIRGSGVDLVRFAHMPLSGGPPVVMFAARLLGDKGIREFVQAAKLLQTRRCRARFVLVGTPDPANPTSVSKAELDAWVGNGSVECWGHRPDMPTVLAQAHIVVLPSYREGLPKVLLEAAAVGRAVVTTDVPGCRDAIEPGVTGVLVPVRNADDLAHAIAELLDDPVRCQRLGEAGRRLAERSFDVNEVVNAHLKIYRELMEKS